MKSKKDIAKQFKDHYDISRFGLKNQYKHIEECQAFYAGDYMKYKDTVLYGRGTSRRVQEVQFNRVKPYVNSIVGFFAQQRRKTDYQARIPEQEEQRALSDYINGLSDYVRENTNADQIETKQDMDLIIGGVGVTDTAITTKEGIATRLPSGEIMTERVNPLHVGWDPESVSTNLLDSYWVYRAKDYDVHVAEELFNADEDDFEFTNPTDDINDYEYNPFGGIQDKIGYEWVDPKRKMVRVYFYQWFEVENFYRVPNPLYGMDNVQLAIALNEAFMKIEPEEGDEIFSFDPNAEILTITKDKRSAVKEVFDLFAIPFNPIVDKRKVYYTAILSGSKVFQAYKSPSQQGFSMKFKTGDRDEVNNIWTGIVASLRQPQRYYNKSLTELMLIIAGNSRGGVLYEESAVDNVQEFEQRWALSNSAVRVNDGALSGGKIQPKATPQLNTGYEGILQVSDQAMSKVTGLDESFFGVIAGGNETAMLQRQRIKQATVTLATYMDAIILYTKEQGRMMLSFMRLLAEASDGSMFNMEDEGGNTVFEVISPDFMADEYDIAIGEAPETPLQKEYYTQTMLGMAQSMQAIGDPRYIQLYAQAVKYMPIPNREKNEIVRILQGQKPIDPAVVEQLQAQIQQLQSREVELMNARMMADINKTNADTENKIADTRKKQIETREVVEDVEKKSIENDIMALKSPAEINVTI